MKAVIIEDEELIALELKRKIRELDTGIEIEEILPSLKVARRWLMNNKEPDFWFMDIQLSDGISFKLFEEFDLKAPVVFTTAYDEYAIKAFRANGVDYLLKPVESIELMRAIEKCRSLAERTKADPFLIKEVLESLRTAGTRGTSGQYKKKFLVQYRNQWQPVSTADIAAFEKASLFYVHTFEGERFVLGFESMEDIEELVDPSLFYRANRQWIVNIEAVKSVKSLDNFKLAVTLKAPLNVRVDISREKATSFRKWLDR